MTPAGKACTTCGETLPLSDFYPSKTGRYGRESKCRACKVEYKRAWRRRTPSETMLALFTTNALAPPPAINRNLIFHAAIVNTKLTARPSN